MAKFRKKPVVVEAVQWFGDNFASMSDFLDYSNDVLVTSRGIVFIQTLEGRMQAKPGDWIIKGVNGEFYPCKPDIFDKTYEPVSKDE